MGVENGNAQDHLWVARAKAGYDRRQEIDAGGGIGGKLDFTYLNLLQGCQGIFHFPLQGKQAARIVMQDFPGVREYNTPSMAFDQLKPGFLFQVLDYFGHGGLTEEELFRRARDMFMLSYRLKYT